MGGCSDTQELFHGFRNKESHIPQDLRDLNVRVFAVLSESQFLRCRRCVRHWRYRTMPAEFKSPLRAGDTVQYPNPVRGICFRQKPTECRRSNGQVKANPPVIVKRSWNLHSLGNDYLPVRSRSLMLTCQSS